MFTTNTISNITNVLKSNRLQLLAYKTKEALVETLTPSTHCRKKQTEFEKTESWQATRTNNFRRCWTSKLWSSLRRTCRTWEEITSQWTTLYRTKIVTRVANETLVKRRMNTKRNYLNHSILASIEERLKCMALVPACIFELSYFITSAKQ